MPDEVSENPTDVVRRAEFAGRVLRLELQGEIDVATSPELGEHLRKALLEGCSSIIVDMAHDVLHTGLAWEKLQELGAFTAVFKVENEA